MKKVVISKLANLENRENVKYLFKCFGKNVALNYLDKFDKAIGFDIGFLNPIYFFKK